MQNSDILRTFNGNRKEFSTYGLTCELWSPSLMKKPDRHNEIEINYFIQDSVTYLFQGNKITIPPKRMALFWGLVPHQIIECNGTAPYYVCTIPFSQFLEWKLPATFVNRVLKGEVIFDNDEAHSVYDEFLLANWLKEMANRDFVEIILLEIRARISRLAITNGPESIEQSTPVSLREISPVEKISVYIAQNYRRAIKVSDIGEAVGLHPDYVNAIFKKAFGCTLVEYIIEERVSHAQRQLVSKDLNITEIAFESGFSSISNFNAAFFKMNNCTPRDFRKKFK